MKFRACLTFAVLKRHNIANTHSYAAYVARRKLERDPALAMTYDEGQLVFARMPRLFSDALSAHEGGLLESREEVVVGPFLLVCEYLGEWWWKFNVYRRLA
jgi:hypothetical protein